MATATAEPRSLPATEGDGHKHKKNALSDGQGRLAWILLAPTLIIIARGGRNPGHLVLPGVPPPDQLRRGSHHRHDRRWRQVRRPAELHRHLRRRQTR